MTTPTPSEIIAARKNAGHSTAEAAADVQSSVRAWQQWEAGDRKMPPAAWDLYLLHTNQHPEKKLVKKQLTHLHKRSMSA